MTHGPFRSVPDMPLVDFSASDANGMASVKLATFGAPVQTNRSGYEEKRSDGQTVNGVGENASFSLFAEE